LVRSRERTRKQPGLPGTQQPAGGYLSEHQPGRWHREI
jgi:hypothetical protein